MQHRAYFRRGFSLLEMSIVLVIIGTVIGASAVLFSSYLKKSQYMDTIAKMEVIQKALYDYRRAYDRLPCPADVTIRYNDPTYSQAGLVFGAEAQLWYNNYLGYGCYDYVDGDTSYYPSANIVDDFMNYVGANQVEGIPPGTMIVEGMVPTRTLGLSDDYAFDGWGRRIMYAVDATTTSPSLTQKAHLPDPGFWGGSIGVTLPRIAIVPYGYDNDASQYPVKTTVALYALLSYGADGHGGYTKSNYGVGTHIDPINTNSTNEYQMVNCNCDLNNPYSIDTQYFTQSSYIVGVGLYPAASYYATLGDYGGLIGAFDYSYNSNSYLNTWNGLINGGANQVIFVQSPPRQNPTYPDGTYDFDDIVVYATRADLPGYREGN